VFEGLGSYSGNVLRRTFHRTKAGSASPVRGFLATIQVEPDEATIH
jgi:hypothetical protein